MSKSNQTLEYFMNGLMRRYKERVPDVGGIIRHMVKDGLITHEDSIENDHVAFRTMGVPQLGIQSLEKIFLHVGYEKRDFYDFPQKKLSAYWYSPPSPKYPRIFISELRVNEMDGSVRNIIKSYTDEVKRDPVDALDLDNGQTVDEFLHRALWRMPTLSDYKALAAKSEYASWVIYNRYYLNHFTVSVHNLPAGYNTIADFNAWVKSKGYKLNDAGGEIKVSNDGRLIQSSTVAAMVDAEFSDGKGGTVSEKIAGSYVEFAERQVLQEYSHLTPNQLKRENRRDGFDTDNANGIFESTYSHQTQKRTLQ